MLRTRLVQTWKIVAAIFGAVVFFVIEDEMGKIS